MRRTRLRHGWEMERTVTSGQDCVVLVEAENGRSASISLVLAGVLGGAESSDTFCGLHSIVFKTFYRKITRNYRWRISSLVVSLITSITQSNTKKKKNLNQVCGQSSRGHIYMHLWSSSFEESSSSSAECVPLEEAPDEDDDADVDGGPWYISSRAGSGLSSSPSFIHI